MPHLSRRSHPGLLAKYRQTKLAPSNTIELRLRTARRRVTLMKALEANSSITHYFKNRKCFLWHNWYSNQETNRKRSQKTFMSYRIREVSHAGKFADLINLGLLKQLITTEAIEQALREAGVKPGRYRKINKVVAIILILGLTLYPDHSIANFLHEFTHQLTNLWSTDHFIPIRDDAFSHRRYKLGYKPLEILWRNTVKPLATLKTKGVYLFGLHLLAIDSTCIDVADTKENAAHFGYPHKTVTCPFPQARAVLLVECGTRAIIDAQISSCLIGERTGGFQFLEKLHPGQLVLWDRGFHSYDFVKAVQKTGADYLGRLPKRVKPRIIKKLNDGSYLAELGVPDDNDHKGEKPIRVRLLHYRLDAKGLPGDGEAHSLISSLLDHTRYPAKKLIEEYHQRWEVETSIGQMKMSMGLGGILRSKKPVGVLQEIYASLIIEYAISYYRHESALAHNIDSDMISFEGTVILLRGAITDGQQYIEEQYDLLHKRLLAKSAQNLVPERDRRFNYRVLKSKRSPYGTKRPKHKNPPKPEKSFGESIVMIVMDTADKLKSLADAHESSNRLVLQC